MSAPRVKIFNHRAKTRDVQYPDYNSWAAAVRSRGYELVELYDEGPGEAAGTGPWGAFKNNRRMGLFEIGRGGTLDRVAPARDDNKNDDKNRRFIFDKATAMGASCADDVRSELRRKIDDWFEPGEREEVMKAGMAVAKLAFARNS